MIINIKKTCNRVLYASVFSAMTSAALAADDEIMRNAGGKMILPLIGVAVTGVNDRCGPIWDFPVHYTLMGEYDPRDGAADAKPLDHTSCDRDDLILATTSDPEFLADFGVPADSDARLKNIPFNQVSVINNPTGIRSQVPYVEDGGDGPVLLNGISSEPYTMGKWLDASGRGKIVCKLDGSAEVFFKLKNMVPKGVYTVWAVWSVEGTSKLKPVPLGGVPNVIAVDEKGRGTFSRNLPSCPLRALEDGTNLPFLDIIYHSDGNATGGAPALAGVFSSFLDSDGSVFLSTTVPGTVVHTHIVFPVGLAKQ